MSNGPGFTINNYPAYPGAWIIMGGEASTPVFFSMPTIHGWETGATGNKLDALLVMPGFRVKVWKDKNYLGTLLIDADNLTTNNANSSSQSMYFDLDCEQPRFFT